MALALRWTVCGLAALCCGCTEIVTVLAPGSPGDTAAVPEVAWGDYSSTLDVPPCLEGEALVVNTTADELDGGSTITTRSQAGATLSLVEALWIAANQPGQANIYFDADVFPAARPATVLLSSASQAPSTASPVCIDGRGRGVVVDWNATSPGSGAIWDVGDGDLQVGLTLLRLPYQQSVAAGGRVAGCRYGTNGREVVGGLGSAAGQLLLLSGGVAGPGNVFTSSHVSAHSGAVTGSFFGYDPATRRTLALANGIAAVGSGTAADLVIEQNVFLSEIAASASPGSGAFTFRDNRVGVDPFGVVHPVVRIGVQIGEQSAGVIIGPGNLIRGAGVAVNIYRASALITRNSIFENAQGIVYYDGAAPLAPPTIDSATSTEARGQCTAAGVVEVFSDASDQGEWYIDQVTCDGAAWTLRAAVPSGRNVTATLTDQQGRTSAFSAPVWVP